MNLTSKKYFFILLTSLMLAASCGGGKKNTTGESLPIEKTDHGENIDTLRVVTLYGPTSYFEYRGEDMGIDYENVKRFANDAGMVLDIKPLDNITDLVAALKEGKAHLAAYPVPSIAEYNSDVLHCGPREVTRQVLIQKDREGKVKDVTELVGKNVHVTKGSKYDYRLNNLNEEIGGGINIIAVDNDTISPEDLLTMVHLGKIDYTVVDSDLASLFKTAFPDLDSSVSLSADQAASWAVAPGLDSLAAKINNWENRTHTSEMVREIYMKYYDKALNDDSDNNINYFKSLNLSKGKSISPYDSYFKQYASTAGYDWKLLAAIAYCESRYNTNAVSPFGATGLMQVMPRSAQSMGVSASELGSPDRNVYAAAKILAKLSNSFENRIENPEERLKFVVAAYNSGPAHIYDAIALAEKLGLDPQKWYANVSVAALMKSQPEYYNDPVVKHGYFRGRETVNFVENVTGIYNYLKTRME